MLRDQLPYVRQAAGPGSRDGGQAEVHQPSVTGAMFPKEPL